MTTTGLGPAVAPGAAPLRGELSGTIRQLPTHRRLVSQAEQTKLNIALPLDAIIVPASRPARNLEQAITLARATSSELLILCSRQVQPAEVQQLLAERSFDNAIVVNLPDGYRHELLDFPALASIERDLPKACFSYSTDLSTKRNVGLILARMLGWQRIFFLDDDIRDITYPDLQSTVSMLGSFPAVGMRVTDYPDNSVVCHAHRVTGASQDVFVTGAALAVDCHADIGFFPDVYNEDWLFFFDDASHGRLATSGLEVTQLRYEPFADPQRAAWQEFGDVLAEGLYGLLHLGKGAQDANRDYWAQFLKARQSFLEAITERSHLADVDVQEQMVLSVKSALSCSAGIKPELCERYIRAWRQDLAGWRRRIARLSTTMALGEALEELRLLPATDRHPAWPVQHRPGATAGNGVRGPVMLPWSGTFRELAERAGGPGHDPAKEPVLTSDYYQG